MKWKDCKKCKLKLLTVQEHHNMYVDHDFLYFSVFWVVAKSMQLSKLDYPKPSLYGEFARHLKGCQSSP